MSSPYRFRDSEPVVHDSVAASVAAAYNQAGGDYITYADGDPTHLTEADDLADDELVASAWALRRWRYGVN